MFAVQELHAFPAQVEVFNDIEEVDGAVQEYGLVVDTATCETCPPVSTSMRLPHLFAHKYCGMEFLEWGKEEWQLCQMVASFVKDNKKELMEDTDEFFKSGRAPASSLMHFSTALKKKFQHREALQMYLLARTCNAHTRVFFKNFIWSTVYDNALFYVAVNLAAIRNDFVALHSHEEEMIECVIGEVRMMVDPYVEMSGSESGSDMSTSKIHSEWPSEVDSEGESDKLLQECTVVLKWIPLYEAFPTLCLATSVPVERLPRSTLYPEQIFKSQVCENTPKCTLFPGHVFVGVSTPNWMQCTVPKERPSVSSKLPGKVFSSWVKPVDKQSVSSKLPGRVFTSHGKLQMNWYHCTVLKENVPVSVRKPGRTFFSASTYKQNTNDAVPKRFQPALSLTRVLCGMHGTAEPLLMFHCHVCKARMDNSWSELKRHVEVLHSLYTCKNAHCVAAFRTASARHIHASVHMKKTRQCTKCSETFQHRFALQRHMTVHATRREHKCQLCKRKYFRPQDLKEHFATAHENEMFGCSTCDYQGKSKRALKQHKLVHKPLALQCEWCDATFRWRSQLAAHVCV